MKKLRLAAVLLFSAAALSLAGCGGVSKKIQEKAAENRQEESVKDVSSRLTVENGKNKAESAADAEKASEKTETAGEKHEPGWFLNGDDYYFYDADGKKMTGWIEDDGKRYHLDDHGVMQTGWQVIDGTDFYFDESGMMREEMWLGDNYLLAGGGYAPRLNGFETGSYYDDSECAHAAWGWHDFHFEIEWNNADELKLYCYEDGRDDFYLEGTEIVPAAEGMDFTIHASGFNYEQQGEQKPINEEIHAKLVNIGDGYAVACRRENSSEEIMLYPVSYWDRLNAVEDLKRFHEVSTQYRNAPGYEIKVDLSSDSGVSVWEGLFARNDWYEVQNAKITVYQLLPASYVESLQVGSYVDQPMDGGAVLNDYVSRIEYNEDGHLVCTIGDPNDWDNKKLLYHTPNGYICEYDHEDGGSYYEKTVYEGTIYFAKDAAIEGYNYDNAKRVTAGKYLEQGNLEFSDGFEWGLKRNSYFGTYLTIYGHDTSEQDGIITGFKEHYSP